MPTGKNRGFLVIQKQPVMKDSRGSGKNVKPYLVSGGVNQLDLSVLLLRFFFNLPQQNDLFRWF